MDFSRPASSYSEKKKIEKSYPLCNSKIQRKKSKGNSTIGCHPYYYNITTNYGTRDRGDEKGFQYWFYFNNKNANQRWNMFLGTEAKCRLDPNHEIFPRNNRRLLQLS